MITLCSLNIYIFTEQYSVPLWLETAVTVTDSHWCWSSWTRLTNGMACRVCYVGSFMVFVINAICYSVEVTAGPYWMFWNKGRGWSWNPKNEFIEASCRKALMANVTMNRERQWTCFSRVVHAQNLHATKVCLYYAQIIWPCYYSQIVLGIIYASLSIHPSIVQQISSFMSSPIPLVKYSVL